MEDDSGAAIDHQPAQEQLAQSQILLCTSLLILIYWEGRRVVVIYMLYNPRKLYVGSVVVISLRLLVSVEV